MATRIARMYLRPATPNAALRAATGWLLAFTLIVIATQAGEFLRAIDASLRDALIGGAMAAGATALGALPILVVRNISASIQSMLLGFGAGVMLAASVFSLLLPGFEAAQARGGDAIGAALTMALGLGIGAALLLGLDRALPHTHNPGTRRTAGAVWLFVFAIAVHNIPEGLAIGVAAGGAGSGDAVATGISLQNVPEGLIVATALTAAGYGRGFAFLVAMVSGLVEPVAALAGAIMLGLSAALLPWGLAAAAGAMLFVVSHEIIPESHRRGHETLATGGLVTGFILMMLLDTMLA
jgi:ZIP family zinc transporter